MRSVLSAESMLSLSYSLGLSCSLSQALVLSRVIAFPVSVQHCSYSFSSDFSQCLSLHSHILYASLRCVRMSFCHVVSNELGEQGSGRCLEDSRTQSIYYTGCELLLLRPCPLGGCVCCQWTQLPPHFAKNVVRTFTTTTTTTTRLLIPAITIIIELLTYQFGGRWCQRSATTVGYAQFLDN